MNKKVFAICLLMLLTLSISAGTHLSLPLGHRAYAILTSAQLRGIIAPLPSAKPYPTSQVIRSLSEIAESPAISQEEKREVTLMINDLQVSYETPSNFNELLFSGSYASYSDANKIGIRFGVNTEMELAHSLHVRGAYDSRNVLRPYFKGDILDFISFNMDFGFRHDRLDSRLFMPNDFSIPTEGKYDQMFDFLAEQSFYYGLDMSPEIALQFLDQKLQFRWASIERDWGVGKNNLMISGSARPFEGIETSIQFSSWLNYQFITGSLGKVWRSYIDTAYNQAYLDNYIFSDGQQGTRFLNNFSAHRVELRLPLNLTFGIYESVVYRRRFELAYLNPFSIIMFQQNATGDFDNMFAGIDVQWRLPGFFRLYGSAATTEMNDISPSRFFKAPRNVLALQGGVDFTIPAANFANLTLQYTYLGPFFYTHYPVQLSYDGNRTVDEIYDLMYVNKGENLGYPLRPNSDEILLSSSFGFANGWVAEITAKYQRRSGQYGFNMDRYMIYRAATGGYYEDKDFNGNLIEKRFGLEITVSKTLEKYPLTFKASYIYHVKVDRTPVPELYWSYTDPTDMDDTGTIAYSNPSGTAYPIQYTVSGPWSDPEYSHALRFGVYIWK